MTDTKHTPTPLRTVRNRKTTSVLDRDGIPIFTTPRHESAAHIKKCVNMHDDCVALATNLVQEWDEWNAKRGRPGAWSPPINAARALIAKANEHG